MFVCFPFFFGGGGGGRHGFTSGGQELRCAFGAAVCKIQVCKEAPHPVLSISESYTNFPVCRVSKKLLISRGNPL